MQSESIKELASALSKAQNEITAVSKEAYNPFFKSKYADLASIIDAIREPLAKNGLSITQMTDFDDDKEFVITQINHTSGEWIRGRMLIKTKDNSPQSQGSGITFARRYALQSALSIPTIDDDGEAAQKSYRGEYTIPFGAHRGKTINELTKEEIIEQGNWLAKSQLDEKGKEYQLKLREAFKK